MDKKTLMENLARKAYERGSFNGTWLYAEHGEIISKGAYGFRDPENKLPMREDSIFEMASITKQFTAAAVMLLVRAGKLGLDDEFTKYFPEFPYPGVRIRHLLTHTSGIPDYDVEDWVAPILEKEKRIPPCSEVLRFICESGEEPVGVPGEKFCYSDIGYTLLANAVEKASGTGFEDFLKKNIFEPAGMKDTGIYHTRRDGIPSDRFVRNMVLEEGGYVPSDRSKRSAGYVVGSDGLNGCDYAYTTVFDMLAWDRTLREGKVLTPGEQQIMYTPARLNSGETFADEDGDGYGFGWGITNDEKFGLIVSHSGGMPGLNTWFERYIDADRVLLIFMSRDPEDARASEGCWDGLRAVARGGEPEEIVSIEDIAVKDPDKSDWESFCGKYEHADDDFIIDEVFLKDGDLYANVEIDGDPETVRLYPIGENEFGRKRGFLKLKFADGSLGYDEHTCKKL
ncbi:MAG: serine hydrolase domain-containing protein [Eubacteriales bacterium]